MPIQRSEPLPECTVCARPTQREAFRRNGSQCSRCRSLRPAWVPTPAELDAQEWQQLVARRGRDERRAAEQRAARAAERRAAKRIDELAARRAKREGPHAR